MEWISAFFRDIDRAWDDGPKVQLQIIGSVALMLQADYVRGTKDGDVLETTALTADVRERLLRIAGPETTLATRHRLYVDIVGSGLPLHALNGSLTSLDIHVLDVVDVVVSKLKRFHANDVEDVAAMIERGLVDHARLVERFREAVDAFAMTAYADDLPKYVRTLHRVERDLFDVAETEIELPDWE